jgi:hypothetical protein
LNERILTTSRIVSVFILFYCDSKIEN